MTRAITLIKVTGYEYDYPEFKAICHDASRISDVELIWNTDISRVEVTYTEDETVTWQDAKNSAILFLNRWLRELSKNLFHADAVENCRVLAALIMTTSLIDDIITGKVEE